MISVGGSHCGYLPRAPKNSATPLLIHILRDANTPQITMGTLHTFCNTNI